MISTKAYASIVSPTSQTAVSYHRPTSASVPALLLLSAQWKETSCRAASLRLTQAQLPNETPYLGNLVAACQEKGFM